MRNHRQAMTLPTEKVLFFILPLVFFFAAVPAFAQGGPPYYTNDPGTPGHLNWEINLALHALSLQQSVGFPYP